MAHHLRHLVGRFKARRLDAALAPLLEQKKWRNGLLLARIKLTWPDLVGPEIASYAQPERLHGKRLIVHCDHDVWRTTLQYLEPELLKRMAEGLGEGVVKEIFLR
jgi:predicted nucleic acid-binding Zn ribbon protein